MKLLGEDQYYKAVEVLNRVTFNHMFASAVVEQKINGVVYADEFDSPTSFYIVHPYGVSLLMGITSNENFNHQIADYLLNRDGPRNRTVWMQVDSEDWSLQLGKLLGDKLLTREKKNLGILVEDEKVRVEEQTRVNFKFNLNKYYEFRSKHPDRHLEIFRTREEEFQNMPGTVVPKFFWNDAAQFLKQGVGFSLLFDNQLACTAFSAYIDDHALEFGIESAAQFRGKGFAMETCATLIDYCLENSLEPVWSCRLENTGSYLLAQKLGFEPVRYLPFYKADI